MDLPIKLVQQKIFSFENLKKIKKKPLILKHSDFFKCLMFYVLGSEKNPWPIVGPEIIYQVFVDHFWSLK